ncbi:dTDP-4-dehydrorhamnose reductase [Paenalcaligenes sp. Me131]|uniref:dTDP-4-dehydrorhamnose reductase n=1 Tax=Paenalcaligenes sp. Me131 TaxID=3392636 RepID=UPI003D2E5B1F
MQSPRTNMTKVPFKVLLCGGSGMLGQELLHSIPDGIDVWAPSSTELDIRHKDVVLQKAATYQPDLIINAAAYTNVDAAETNEALAFAINRDGPENLGIYAAQANIPVFHISTDYVFDGTKGEPYTEEDEPNPINVYGKSKLAGERALQQVCERSLILRTSWLVGVHGDCFMRRFIKLMTERERIFVVADQYSAPTRADLFAAFIWCLASRSKEAQFIPRGALHCAGKQCSSKYELIEHLRILLLKKKKHQKCMKVESVSYRFFENSAKRPAFSLLGTTISNKRLTDSYDFLGEGLDKIIVRLYEQTYPDP